MNNQFNQSNFINSQSNIFPFTAHPTTGRDDVGNAQNAYHCKRETSMFGGSGEYEYPNGPQDTFPIINMN